MNRENTLSAADDVVDKSTDETVVEYAVRMLLKKQCSPAVAAAATAKKLNGGTNIFLGPGTVQIDPKVLETAIYQRFADTADKIFKSSHGRETKESSASSALQNWYGFNDVAGINKKYGKKVVSLMKASLSAATSKEPKVTVMNRKEVVKTILATAKLLAATPPAKVSAGAGYLALLDQVLGVISTDDLEGMRKDLVKLKKDIADSQNVTRKLEDKVQGIIEQISDELSALSEDLTEDDKAVADTIAKLKDMPSSRATASVLEGSALSAATLPEVNANGTDKADLLKGYTAAVAACRQLMDTLDACWPNARDYPPGQYAKAREEHQLWMKQAKEMGIELYEIVDAIESAAKQPGRFG